jgi:hypothetical protein
MLMSTIVRASIIDDKLTAAKTPNFVGANAIETKAPIQMRRRQTGPFRPRLLKYRVNRQRTRFVGRGGSCVAIRAHEFRFAL